MKTILKNTFLFIAICMSCLSSLPANEPVAKTRTFAMIKPGAVKRQQIGSIIQMIEKAQLKVIALRMEKLSKEKLTVFYKEHEGRPFFANLLEVMSSGPVVALCIEGDNAVLAVRELVGATDPEKAKEGTIRKIFGVSLTENAIHASDSDTSAQRELALFFTKDDIFPQL